MYTQCPECLSVFFVSADVLGQSRGELLCGQCGVRFDALDTLAEHLPTEAFTRLTAHATPDAPITIDAMVPRPRPEPEPVAAPPVASPPSPATPPVAAASNADYAQLVFAPRAAKGTSRRHKRPSYRHLRPPSPHRALWTIACTVLLLVLAGQAAWAERDTLITQPTTGKWLRATCAALRCDVPLVSAPNRMQVVDSDVQNYPGMAHALLISARIRNAADFAQPYPVLSVTLSDANGKSLAMRRLRPREYLDDPAILRRGMAPGEASVVLLEVADPGNRAVEFKLGFE